MTPLYGMTRRQMDLLVYLHRYISEHGYSPSYAEIMEGVGFSSKSNVAYQVDQLESRGLVRRLPHRSRSLCLTDAGYDHAERYSARSASVPVPRVTTEQAA